MDANCSERFSILSAESSFNRYRRRLETCPQANLHQSGREYFLFLFSNASERPVWLSAESKILASTLVQIRLYRLIDNNIRYIIYPKDLEKQGDLRDCFVVLTVSQLWNVAPLISRAPPYHTLPAFINLNGSKSKSQLLRSTVGLAAER